MGSETLLLNSEREHQGLENSIFPPSRFGSFFFVETVQTLPGANRYERDRKQDRSRAGNDVCELQITPANDDDDGHEAHERNEQANDQSKGVFGVKGWSDGVARSGGGWHTVAWCALP